MAGLGNVMMVGMADIKSVILPEQGIEDRLKVAMAAMKDHWLVANEDERFRCAVGAVMLSYGADSDEHRRIVYEMECIQKLNAVLVAAQAGLCVNLPDEDEDAAHPEPLRLLDMWREVNGRGRLTNCTHDAQRGSGSADRCRETSGEATEATPLFKASLRKPGDAVSPGSFCFGCVNRVNARIPCVYRFLGACGRPPLRNRRSSTRVGNVREMRGAAKMTDQPTPHHRPADADAAGEDRAEPPLTLAEFAETEQAKANAASWEKVLPKRRGRGKGAKGEPQDAVATADAPGAAGAGEPGPEAGSLVEALKARSREIRRSNSAQNLSPSAFKLCGVADGLDEAAALAAPREARWQADRTALGELLAIIFRDGGHRQAEIGDNAKAGEEAQTVVLADRRRADEAEKRAHALDAEIDELHHSVVAERQAAEADRTALAELCAGMKALADEYQEDWSEHRHGESYSEWRAGKYVKRRLLALLLPGPESAAADARPAAGVGVESEPEKRSCTAETPCCDRRDEYNGFGTGPLIFTCPKGCSCHD